MINIKESLYLKCADIVESSYQTIQDTINEIQESLTSETKSSAGDKHETGRAMLQIERENAGNQLAEIQKLKAVISKIDISKTSKIVGLGSVVFTTQNNYFMAISAGKIEIDSTIFYAISPNTPIGQLLLGKTVGDEIVFREQKFNIKNVF